MSQRRFFLRGAAVLLSACALGLPACGSDSNTDNDLNNPPASAAGGSSAGAPASGGTSAPAGIGGSAGTGGAGVAPPAGGPAGGTTESGAGAGGSVEPEPPPMPVPRESEFDAGSDPDRNKVAPAQLCTRIAEINCAGEAFCCDQRTRTVETCKADLLKTCADELALDQIAMAPAVGFDAAAAEAAYTELEKKASKCDPTVAAWGSSQEGLRGILKGTLAAGANCAPAATIPTPVQIATALVSCNETATQACLFTDILGPWTCAPKAAAGGACASDNNCQAGLFCLIAGLSTSGSCTAQKEVGAACTAPTECASLFCKASKCVEATQQAAYCLEN
ncbi:MAG: hypothetical protein ABW321_05930 [Polyangiales bacterium]